jgi:hypothetical protein|tara:strand:+ start:4769 stop:5002 length:234 start_codon:yes stop_codon:yes gene_type:complete
MAPKQEHDLYWDAFWELHTERNFGMGFGPIPVSMMWAYTKSYEMCPIESRAFVYIMRALDNTFLSHQNASKSKSAKK